MSQKDKVALIVIIAVTILLIGIVISSQLKSTESRQFAADAISTSIHLR